MTYMTDKILPCSRCLGNANLHKHKGWYRVRHVFTATSRHRTAFAAINEWNNKQLKWITV